MIGIIIVHNILNTINLYPACEHRVSQNQGVDFYYYSNTRGIIIKEIVGNADFSSSTKLHCLTQQRIGPFV